MGNGARLVSSRSGDIRTGALGYFVVDCGCGPAAEWDTPRSVGNGARLVPSRSGAIWEGALGYFVADCGRGPAAE